ncbi:MAG TPA: hypothetical protein VM912_07925 [Terriglobales bacterium]|nr:hypothetical protein [Terriglobales bacterium]
MEVSKAIRALALSVLAFLRGDRARRFAIEVEEEHADAFSIPGTQICDRWENTDGSVVFVILSLKGISSQIQAAKGMCRVSLL